MVGGEQIAFRGCGADMAASSGLLQLTDDLLSLIARCLLDDDLPAALQLLQTCADVRRTAVSVLGELGMQSSSRALLVAHCERVTH